MSPVVELIGSACLSLWAQEYEKILATCAEEEFGGNHANGLHFINGPTKYQRRCGRYRQILSCPFAGPHQSNCPYRMEHIYSQLDVGLDDGTDAPVYSHSLHQDENLEHSDHFLSNAKSQVRLIVKAQLTNNMLMFQTPNVAVGEIRKKLKVINPDFEVDSDQAMAVKQWMVSRKQIVKGNGQYGKAGTVGAWSQLIEDMESQDDPTVDEPNKVFVCGKSIVERDRLMIVLSTNNMLLNTWRQQQLGFASLVTVDTTWRLTSEGLGVIVVGTSSRDQSFHTIAYALVNKEDGEMHEAVFRSIKKDAERVVSMYGQAGLHV